MKKLLAMLLTFVMLLSLCACGNNGDQTTDPSSSSQTTTNSTEKPTDGTEGTTGTTQAPTELPTTAPTEEPTTPPTETPTTPPTEAPTTPPTEAPTTPPTEAPTTPPTEAPTTPPTEAPTTPPTEAPTTPPTEAPTTPPTEAPTTPPTEAPTTPPTTQPTACSHSWKDATCTDPKTCSKCGATTGNPEGHSWTEATCTTPKTCSRCGTTEGGTTAHSWKNATCTAPKTCSKCGTTEGSAAGHSYSGGTCSACGAADPNYNPLTDGAWLWKSDSTWEFLIFHTDGTCSRKLFDVSVPKTSDDFDAHVNAYIESIKDRYASYWEQVIAYSVIFEMNGERYIGNESVDELETYTVDGNQINLTYEAWSESYMHSLILQDANTLWYEDVEAPFYKVSYTYISDVLSYVN